MRSAAFCAEILAAAILHHWFLLCWLQLLQPYGYPDGYNWFPLSMVLIHLFWLTWWLPVCFPVVGFTWGSFYLLWGGNQVPSGILNIWKTSSNTLVGQDEPFIVHSGTPMGRSNWREKHHFQPLTHLFQPPLYTRKVFPFPTVMMPINPRKSAEGLERWLSDYECLQLFQRTWFKSHLSFGS